MADPVSGALDWNQIFTYAGALFGTGIGALALRMGWKSGAKELSGPTDTVEIKSAIVDSSSIKVLAGSIEGLGFTLLELKKNHIGLSDEQSKMIDKLIDSIEQQTEEIRQLSREIRDHAREIAKAK